MVRRGLAGWFTLLLLLLPVGPAVGQEVAAPPHLHEARDLAERLVAARMVPAIAIGVLQDDQVVWAEGFGLADVAGGRAATADTAFRLASISKPFTATALMCLVDDGVLALDDPANRHLDARLVAHRGDPTAMTLRRLANHTAGLPTHWNFFYAGTAPPPRDVTIARYGFAAWQPGTHTNYSNLAFGVLDHVIARRSGTSFAAFLRQRVLAPLGMGHTSVGPPAADVPHALGYRSFGDGAFLAVVDYGFDHDGASAVWSSARDLLRFARVWMHDGSVDGARVLGAAATRTMLTPTREVEGNSYGVGWRVDHFEGQQRIGHTGGMPGVSTALEVFPELRAAVAVLTNGSDRRATQQCLAAVRRAIVPAAAVEPAAPPAASPPAEAEAAAVPTGTFVGHVHTFVAPIAARLQVQEDGGCELRLGGERFADRATRRDGRLVLRGKVLLPTTDGFHGTPDVEIELWPAADGWSGVAYATADGVFRLPHWVHVRAADDR